MVILRGMALVSIMVCFFTSGVFASDEPVKVQVKNKLSGNQEITLKEGSGELSGSKNESDVEDQQLKKEKIAELASLTTLNPEQFEKAGLYISGLKQLGFTFYNVVTTEDIHNFLDLREALQQLRGKAPPDEMLFNDLYKTWMNFSNFQSQAYVLCPTQTKSLRHCELQLKVVGKTIDYGEKFAGTQVIPNPGCWQKFFGPPDRDFYKKIYKALSSSSLLSKARYPDESNGKLWNANSRKKKDHLIHILMSIKDPEATRNLTSSIRAESDIHYPTRELPSTWFAEMRYKLYHLSRVIPSLNDTSKVTVLSYLLHAGANCNDAKRSVIDDLFKNFCKTASYQLLAEEEQLATSLKDRVQLVAAQEKSVILERIINTTIDAMISGQAPLRVRRDTVSSAELERERVTVFQATWDQYAPVFGLSKKKAFYSSYAVELSEIFTDKGNYSPAHLYQVVSHKHGPLKEKILDEYIGSMKYIFSHHEAVILGALQEMGFFKPVW